MNGTTVIRMLLNGSFNMIQERLDGMTDEEWRERALPGTSKLGFCALFLAFELADHRPDLARSPFESISGNVERRSDTDNSAVRIFRQDAAGKQSIDDVPRGCTRRVDLDADEQAAAADVGHDRPAQILQIRNKPGTELRRAVDQFLLEQNVERRHRHDGGKR